MKKYQFEANNFIECYHLLLNDTIENFHLIIPFYLEKIKLVFQTYYNDYISNIINLNNKGIY